jgi:tRNA (cmo5U34)-methyltransferase
MNEPAFNIPADWTFNRPDIAAGFDKHVREQLPWYDLATGAVAHIVRHFLPENGLIYDIGASTGNIGEALRDSIASRNARMVAVEKSAEMAACYRGPGECVEADALTFDFQPCDVCVCFLVLMFIPVSERAALVEKLVKSVRPGGALIIFDKTEYRGGYLSTVMHRLTIAGKVATGCDPSQIIRKELSLSGTQRPLSVDFIEGFDPKMIEVFRFGEFAGWIIEKTCLD